MLVATRVSRFRRRASSIEEVGEERQEARKSDCLTDTGPRAVVVIDAATVVEGAHKPSRSRLGVRLWHGASVQLQGHRGMSPTIRLNLLSVLLRRRHRLCHLRKHPTTSPARAAPLQSQRTPRMPQGLAEEPSLLAPKRGHHRKKPGGRSKGRVPPRSRQRLTLVPLDAPRWQRTRELAWLGICSFTQNAG